MELRRHLDEHLEEIFNDIIKMSNKVQKMLKHACDVLQHPNDEQADAIIKEDKYIDIIEMSIDDHCLQLIATEQPVATDLRRIISITKLTADLERIGDIARYMAKKSKKEIPDNFKSIVPLLIDMCFKGIDMLARAIAAFVKNDEHDSRNVATEDDQIDSMHHEIQRKIITEMKNDPEHIKNGQRLLEINRLIELLGDRVTTICEWTIFSVQGKHIDLN